MGKLFAVARERSSDDRAIEIFEGSPSDIIRGQRKQHEKKGRGNENLMGNQIRVSRDKIAGGGGGGQKNKMQN